jgi:hypothetical protein
MIIAKVACQNSTAQCRNVEIKTCRNGEMPKQFRHVKIVEIVETKIGDIVLVERQFIAH